MPKIRQYEAGDLTIRPDDRASSASANAARAVGALMQTAGNLQMDKGVGEVIRLGGKAVYDFTEARERSAGAATAAEMQHNLTKTWDQWVKDADPNDPELADKFRTTVMQPALDKWRESFWTEGGQQYADRTLAQTRDHFFQKTTADMSTLAGEAAALNARRATNLLTNMVKDDPSALTLAMTSLDDSVVAAVRSSPNITGTQAAKLVKGLKQEGMEAIVLAAVTGAIQRNPTEGVKLASDPRFAPFISGEKVKSLEAFARSEQRAARAEERYNEVAKERLEQKQSDATEIDILKRIEAGEKVTKADMLDLPPEQLNRQAKERLLSRMETMARREEALPAVSRPIYLDLSSRIRLPEEDPNRVKSLDEIWEAQKDLTHADFNRLVNQFREQRTPDGAQLQERERAFFESLKPQFNGDLDKEGPQRLYNLQMEYFRRKGELMQQGKSPYLLLDPASPEYMGKQQTLQGFQVPLDEQARNLARRMTGGMSVDERKVREQYPDAEKLPNGGFRVKRVNPATGKEEYFRVTPR